ncbi:MAG: response regulator [Oscillospiraceae bacterium]|nr:response regulator [Oscillospiraceae bacterium]
MLSYKNCIVMVVDDDPASLSATEELFTDLGIACFAVDNGGNALRILAHNEPDLILINPAMPDMDGAELCRRIRIMGGAFIDVPILALTGGGAQAEYLGFNGLLTKPLELSELERFMPSDEKREPDPDKRSILAIDDGPINLQILENTLGGDYHIRTELSGTRALRYLRENIPDLILLDINMPVMDGYEAMAAFKSDSRLDDIPVIFLTGSEDVEDEIRALETGAVDFIKKPIEPTIVTARVRLHLELELYRKSLERVVLERTEKLQRTADAILSLLANVASYRDEETGTHILRTTDYVRLIVRLLQQAGLPGYYVSSSYGEYIIKSAKLHDIGKVAVSDGILLKPGKLTDEEFEEMKCHTVYGAQMIDDAIRDLEDDTYLRVAREIVIGHHEKWNGKGYPYGLEGREIPLSARIMAIADVYDALISERPYKKPFPHEKAVEIIMEGGGTHFDPVILNLTRGHFDEFDKIAKMNN